MAANAIIDQSSGKSAVIEYQDELKDMWGVYNRADLLTALKWIETCGHRTYYEEIVSQVKRSGCDLSQSDLYSEIIKHTWNNPEETLNKFEVVKRFHKTTARKSLIGWDYCRYIHLCRLGCKFGYLSEDEAWNKIINASELLQETFDSWEDLANNYMIGHEFWSYRETVKKNNLFRNCIALLAKNPQSPWKKVSWKTNLKN